MLTRPVLPSRWIELTWPTLTPAMRTGDLGWMFDGRRELGLQAEAVFERDVLGEAEVHGDRDDHDQHDPGAHGVRRAAAR